jgi:hypothetical protein
VLLGGLYLLTGGLTTLLQTGGVWTLGDTFASDWVIAVVVGIVVTPVWAVGLGVVAWELVKAFPRVRRDEAPHGDPARVRGWPRGRLRG